MTIKCKICKKRECYLHCQKTEDGQRLPDPKSVRPADGHGTNWIIDVTCSECFYSGSMRINPTEFNWS